jgi:hypothetical protein
MFSQSHILFPSHYQRFMRVTLHHLDQSSDLTHPTPVATSARYQPQPTGRNVRPFAALARSAY